MAVCIAVIGKDVINSENSPRFLCCLQSDVEMELQYQVHAALDVVEERLGGIKPGQDVKDLYLGLLYSTETHKIFGYVTNTKVKFIIVVDSANTALRDNEVRNMFKKLHLLYSDAVCNPFYIPGEQITSMVFERNVRSIAAGNTS